MNFKLVPCVLLIGIGISNAQSTKYFEKFIYTPFPNYEEAWKVCSLPDGYLLSGYNLTAPGPVVQGQLIKTDFYGDIIWNITLSDPSNYTWFFDAVVVNNNYIFAGANYDTSSNILRTLIYKTDTSGAMIWKIVVGDSVLNNFVQSIFPTQDSGFVLSGHIELANQSWEGYMIKLDSTGVSQWTRQFSGPLDNNNISIKQLDNGTYITTGYTNFALGSGSARLIILDSLGNNFLDTSYTFQNNTQSGNDILETLDGNIIICGESGSAGAVVRGLIFKTDFAGNMLWYKLLSEFSNGSGYFFSSNLHSMVELQDSSIVCAGYLIPHTGIPITEREFRLLILKMDQNGNELWRRLYTPLPTFPTYGMSIDVTADNGFIVSGRTDSINNGNIYYIKTNCLGFLGPPVADFNSLVNGTSATFFNLSQNADTCVYYFGDGDSLLITQADTLPIVHNYSSQGWFNAFMIAYACGETDTTIIPLYSGLNNEQEFIERAFTIMPNPVTDYLNISYTIPNNSQNAVLEINDITGRMIETITLIPASGLYVLDVSAYKHGTYLIALHPDGMKSFLRRFIR